MHSSAKSAEARWSSLWVAGLAALVFGLAGCGGSFSSHVAGGMAQTAHPSPLRLASQTKPVAAPLDIGDPEVVSSSGPWRLTRAPAVVLERFQPDLGKPRLQYLWRLNRSLPTRTSRAFIRVTVDGHVGDISTSGGLGWTGRAPGRCYSNLWDNNGTQLALRPGDRATFRLTFYDGRTSRVLGRIVARTRVRAQLRNEQDPEDPRWYRALGCRPS